MKIALIQDSLLVCAGAERVFKCLVEEFADADIYTLSYNKKTTCPFFAEKDINVSWLNIFVRTHKLFKLFFPISTYVMQFWNFKSYDLIISSSATTAKYISRFKGKHYCFGYFPTRAIWDYDRYFIKKDIKSKIMKVLLPYLKKRDLKAARRVTKFIAQSQISKEAMYRIYGVDAPLISSPIDYNKFKEGINEKKSDFFLIVSRLEEWKKLHYAIEAFNELGKKLIIVGIGSLKNELNSIAKENIQFLGKVSDDKLVKLYGQSKALIFTPSLEYGLPPLEANAAGTPVIAFGEGAINETMISYTKNNDKCTAILFDTQNKESLIKAIEFLDKVQFNRSYLSEYASTFSEHSFRKRFRSLIEKNNQEN